MKFDVIVIGGGAAGLLCAIEAGKRGRRTLVIEHNVKVGRKIIISGGGRCNFTNLHTSPENFISQNPHFAKSALSRFTPQDFIELVNSHRIDFYEKKNLASYFAASVLILSSKCCSQNVERRR